MDKPLHLDPVSESTAFDYAVTAATLGAMVFPFLGAGTALVDLVTKSMRGKRLEDFCERLRLGLNDLSQKIAGLTPAKLAASEEFNSAFFQAAQAAVKTHHVEKLEALRNALLNVAAGTLPDEARQSTFVSLVDRLQPAHLQILKRFQDWPPSGKYNSWKTTITIQNPGTPTRWIKEFVSGLRNEDPDFIRMLVTDLYNSGLSFIKPDATNLPSDGRWITELGTSFLRFTSEPAL
jgi:hypothetical protein